VQTVRVGRGSGDMHPEVVLGQGRAPPAFEYHTDGFAPTTARMGPSFRRGQLTQLSRPVPGRGSRDPVGQRLGRRPVPDRVWKDVQARKGQLLDEGPSRRMVPLGLAREGRDHVAPQPEGADPGAILGDVYLERADANPGVVPYVLAARLATSGDDALVTLDPAAAEAPTRRWVPFRPAWWLGRRRAARTRMG